MPKQTPDGEVTLNDELLSFRYLHTEQDAGSPSLAVRIIPTDAYAEISKGDRLTVRQGIRTAAGDFSGYTLVRAGRVRTAPRSFLMRATGGEAQILTGFELTLDATDRRFRRPPPRRLWFDGQRAVTAGSIAPNRAVGLHAFLMWAARAMGFGDMITNLPDVKIRAKHTEVQPGSSYFDTLSSLLASFEPLIFSDAHAAESALVLIILDTRRPLPAETPRRTLPRGDYFALESSPMDREPVNWVEITYDTRALADNEDRDYRDTEEQVEEASAPNGFPSFKQWLKWRVWLDENGQETGERTSRGERSQSWARTGEIITKYESDIELYEGTDVEHTRQDTWWQRVQLPGGGTEVIKTKQTRAQHVHRIDENGDYQIVSTHETEAGFVLFDGLTPIETASHAGVVRLDAGQEGDWMPIGHRHVTYTESSPGWVRRVTYPWDDLRHAPLDRIVETYPGTTKRTPSESTDTLERRDETSIAADGLFPMQAYDARVWGPALGAELVEEHVFAYNRLEGGTSRLRLVPFDTSWLRGDVIALDPPVGTDDPLDYLVRGWAHTNDATSDNPDDWTSSSQLVVERVEIEAL